MYPHFYYLLFHLNTSIHFIRINIIPFPILHGKKNFIKSTEYNISSHVGKSTCTELKQEKTEQSYRKNVFFIPYDTLLKKPRWQKLSSDFRTIERKLTLNRGGSRKEFSRPFFVCKTKSEVSYLGINVNYRFCEKPFLFIFSRYNQKEFVILLLTNC